MSYRPSVHTIGCSRCGYFRACLFLVFAYYLLRIIPLSLAKRDGGRGLRASFGLTSIVLLEIGSALPIREVTFQPFSKYHPTKSIMCVKTIISPQRTICIREVERPITTLPLILVMYTIQALDTLYICTCIHWRHYAEHVEG